MAFFDNLGKKISQAGQTAVQKTKEMADIAKLNSCISDEERKIKDSYSEIGKLYMSLHDEDHEAAFSELVVGIHAAEKQIAEYQQQIKDIKGVVCCEKCGAEVTGNAAFCSSCGAPMPVVKPVETEEKAAAKCSKCGAELAPDTKFCTTCGAPVEAPAAPVTEAPAAEAPTTEAPATEAAPAAETPATEAAPAAETPAAEAAPATEEAPAAEAQQ